MVERTLIRPPSSQLGPITARERKDVISTSPIAGKYETAIDRDSAFERLRARTEEAARAAEEAEREEERLDKEAREHKRARRYDGRKTRTTSGRKSDSSFASAITNVVMKELKGTTGRRIVRGILGSLFKAR